MSLEQKAKILQAVTSLNICRTRDLVHFLKKRIPNVIFLLRQMEEEKLIEVTLLAGSKKGRPKKYVNATSLGYNFLDSYKKFNLKQLRATKADIDHAVKDGLYACRLAEKGHSTFEVFMELNAIAGANRLNFTLRKRLAHF